MIEQLLISKGISMGYKKAVALLVASLFSALTLAGWEDFNKGYTKPYLMPSSIHQAQGQLSRFAQKRIASEARKKQEEIWRKNRAAPMRSDNQGADELQPQIERPTNRQRLDALINSVPNESQIEFGLDVLRPFYVAVRAGEQHREALKKNDVLNNMLSDYSVDNVSEMRYQLYEMVSHSLATTINDSFTNRGWPQPKPKYYHLFSADFSDLKDYEEKARELFYYIRNSNGHYEPSRVDTRQTANFLFYHLGLPESDYIVLRERFLSEMYDDYRGINPLEKLIRFIAFLVVEHTFESDINIGLEQGMSVGWNPISDFSQEGTSHRISESSYKSLQRFLYMAEMKTYTLLSLWLDQSDEVHACHSYNCYGYLPFILRLIIPMYMTRAAYQEERVAPYEGFDPTHFHWYQKAWKGDSKAKEMRGYGRAHFFFG